MIIEYHCSLKIIDHLWKYIAQKQMKISRSEQGRTGTKYFTGHKPPRGGRQLMASQGHQYWGGVCMCVNTIEIKPAESKLDIFWRGSKQLGFGDAVSPPMGPGAKPRKILRFQVSRSPKIDYSIKKGSCSVSSRFLLLRKFCPRIAVSTS